MSDEQNIEVFRRALEPWSSLERQAEYFDLYVPDVAIHVHGFDNVAGLRPLYEALWAGFPDAKPTMGDLVADCDKLAYRVTINATHLGQSRTLPLESEIRLSQWGSCISLMAKWRGGWGHDYSAGGLQQLRPVGAAEWRRGMAMICSLATAAVARATGHRRRSAPAGTHRPDTHGRGKYPAIALAQGLNDGAAPAGASAAILPVRI